MSNALNKLLSMENETLELRKREADGCIIASYTDAYIKDGLMLLGIYGVGQTVDEACENYLKEINGKSLVFHPTTSIKRYEARILT